MLFLWIGSKNDKVFLLGSGYRSAGGDTVSINQWCSRDRNLWDRDRDLAQISRRDQDFVMQAETETWKFETETRDLTFLWW